MKDKIVAGATVVAKAGGTISKIHPKTKEIEERPTKEKAKRPKKKKKASTFSLSLIPFYLPQLEKKSRTSLTKTFGLSRAAKWPPEAARVKCLRLLPAATQALGGLKSSRGMSRTAVGTRT